MYQHMVLKMRYILPQIFKNVDFTLLQKYVNSKNFYLFFSDDTGKIYES